MSEIQSAEIASGQNAYTLQLLGRVHLLAGDYDQAIQNYHLAMIRSPENPNLLLELSIAFALRANKENRALDYERALETILQIDHSSQIPEVLFDTALLFEEVPLPRQAVERWQLSAAQEQSVEWRAEIQQKLTARSRSIANREEGLQDITAFSYTTHPNEATNSLELVVSTALEKWIPKLYDSPHERTAITMLASAIEAKYKDPWLSDLLRLEESPDARTAIESLSKAITANIQGAHIYARELASIAERLFRKLNNPAGALRSQVESAYALHRQFRLKGLTECLDISSRVRDEANQRGYHWIEGQAWLEQITCSAYLGQLGGTAEREEAYKRISEAGYTVLGSRALCFLVDPDASFGSRLELWKQGRTALVTFWSSPIPGLRAEQFYLTLAISERNAGKLHTALALLQEGALAIQDQQYRHLLAGLLADLGAWQSEAGLKKDAELTFSKMEKLFDKLDQQEVHDLRLEAEVVRAQAEVANAQPHQAVARLRRVIKGIKFPHSELAANVRTRLIPTLGDALLANGDIDEALKYYREAISQYFAGLAKIHDSDASENIQHLEPAWRGLAYATMRLGRPREALLIWEQFRSAHTTKGRNTYFKPPKGTVLLAYAFVPQGLSAWLVDSNGVEQRWIDPKSVTEYSQQFSRLAADPDSPISSVSRNARLLYEALIAPFEPRLPAQGFIVVDPDGPLAEIPWAALEDEKGHALIEKFGVVQVAGWAEAGSTVMQRPLDMSKPLIFADPALGKDLSNDYPRLADALLEAKRLQARLPHATFVHGEEATLPALLQNLPSASTFHFAGHGVSYGGFGALLLAPSPTDRDAAKLLTADEIIGMDLSGVQLIVLAACSSGEGEQSGVVSVDSLVRAFLDAKARTVVASRWKADSNSTSVLMGNLYDGIISGQTPVEALRKAALVIRTDSRTAHPYFWASFQVFGTP